MKRALKNLLLTAATLAAMVLVLEGVLRTTHVFGARVSWTEPDSLIGWRYTPGRTYWYFAENDHAITGRINSHGWRDRERTPEKPAGTYRIAVVGDSFVEAFQVELESTFVAIAERELESRLQRRVEVLNFGRAGMTQTEELLVLERDVFRWLPDVVVLLFVPQNDIADVDPSTTDNALRPFFRGADGDSLRLDTSFREERAFKTKVGVNTLKQQSALVSLVAERYNAWRLARRRAVMEPGDAHYPSRTLSLCTSTPDPAYAANLALCKRLLARVAAACDARGCDFLLVCAPWVYEARAAERYRRVDPSFDPGFFEAELAAWADAAGVDFLGLQHPFAAHHAATGERLHWGHWNTTGHRLAGAVLAARLGDLLTPDVGN